MCSRGSQSWACLVDGCFHGTSKWQTLSLAETMQIMEMNVDFHSASVLSTAAETAAPLSVLPSPPLPQLIATS